jgi:hypothetical protein
MASNEPQFHSYLDLRQSVAVMVKALLDVKDRDTETLAMLPPLGQELNSHLIELLEQPSENLHDDFLFNTTLQLHNDTPVRYRRERPMMNRTIETGDLNDHLAEDSVLQFPHLHLSEGDTLVFVDMPVSVQASTNHRNCHGDVPNSQVFRVHSEKLFALTTSKFPGMLRSKNHQRRVKNHRNLSDDQLQGIDYFLDLTPDIEGDDAASHISDMSLSPGLVKWPASMVLHNADMKLVAGHDDVCACQSLQLETGQPSPDPAANRLALTPGEILQLRGEQNHKLFKTAPHLQIPDYCQVRHANAIIRLMLMIEGYEVTFSSAARMWTIMNVSKIYGCKEVVRDTALAWITANPVFIEMLPEEALSLASSLELPQVARLAFNILVHEAAIEGFGEEDAKQSKLTVFGRQKGQLGDELSNLVQHGASALMDRVMKSLDWFEKGQTLIGWSPPQVKTLSEIEEIIHIEYDGDLQALTHVDGMRAALRYPSGMDVVSGCNSNALSGADGNVLSEMDMCRAKYVEYGANGSEDFVGLRAILSRLRPEQKLVCPFIYHGIRDRFRHWAFENTFDTSISAHEQLKRALQGLTEKYLNPVNIFPNFDMDTFRFEIAARAQTWTWLETRGPDTKDIQGLNSPLPLHMNLTLTRHEMKYLPLWAGGENDGTGRVFAPVLPPAEMGPNGPGPAYHTGFSEAPSLPEEILNEIEEMRLRASTVVGSNNAQDSLSTVYSRHQVIATGSSIASESFVDDDSEIHAAVREARSGPQSSSHSDEMVALTPGSTSGTSSVMGSSGDDFEIVDSASDSSDDTIIGA